MDIAERVKKRRAELGLSQAAVIKRLPPNTATQQALARIEAGNVRRPGWIIPLARALECDPEWLIGDPPASSGGDDSESGNAQIIGEIMSVASGLSDQDLRSLLRQVRALRQMADAEKS